jgi:hypothetical protein
MKQAIGFFLALFVFTLLSIFLVEIFKKSPEQIAKEKCIGLVQLAKMAFLDRISVEVDGKIYQCDMNLKYE